MDKKLIRNNFLKLWFANTILSVIMYICYLCMDSIFPVDFFGIEGLPSIIIALILILLIGLLFHFKNTKEAWVVCNVFAIGFGLIFAILSYVVFNEKAKTIFPDIFVFQFYGVYAVCLYSVWDYFTELFATISSILLFIICQNLFLLPMLIKDRIQKRKKGTKENTLIDTKE